ncbi:MAG: hypothetical protein JWP88_2180 [Flaviaesturariibacter sp.]|nr:hypothetical protein [Flaviaesturariibacter sp.]
MKRCLALFCILWMLQSQAQSYIARDIHSFGAKGDGKTDDHAAFEKASRFFNERGGFGKLIISKGIYLVGKQVFNNSLPGKAVYAGYDVLHFENVRQMTIAGEKDAMLRFKRGLYFGAFDSLTGKPVSHNSNSFKGHRNGAFIGNCLYIGRSAGVRVSNLQLDGNNDAFILGGADTDGDRQLAHYGIYIQDSRNVNIESIRAHHFGLDGICIANSNTPIPDSILLRRCQFDSNARQGLSWIGGNNLNAQDCHFDGTGQGRFRSAPSAGVDIEGEEGAIANGVFESCTFIHNKRFGLVAHSGDSRACTFIDCTFWGVDSWALWVSRPAFRFLRCRIFGAFVNGYDAETAAGATTFKQCLFEDKGYRGKPAFGDYLIETNNKRRVSFDSCRFISHRSKLIWVAHDEQVPPDSYYRFTHCSMQMANKDLPGGDFVAYFKGAYLQGCSFRFTDKAAKQKRYRVLGFGDASVIDGGGNSIKYE